MEKKSLESKQSKSHTWAPLKVDGKEKLGGSKQRQ
jgi:hypothetical protein